MKKKKEKLLIDDAWRTKAQALRDTGMSIKEVAEAMGTTQVVVDRNTLKYYKYDISTAQCLYDSGNWTIEEIAKEYRWDPERLRADLKPAKPKRKFANEWGGMISNGKNEDLFVCLKALKR